MIKMKGLGRGLDPDFHMAADGRITARRKAGRAAPFVYTGVQILDPKVIENHPDGPFSTNLFWNRSLEKERLYGVVHQGMWFDVGSPPAIPATEPAFANTNADDGRIPTQCIST